MWNILGLKDLTYYENYTHVTTLKNCVRPTIRKDSASFISSYLLNLDHEVNKQSVFKLYLTIWIHEFWNLWRHQPKKKVLPDSMQTEGPNHTSDTTMWKQLIWRVLVWYLCFCNSNKAEFINVFHHSFNSTVCALYDTATYGRQ